MTSTRQPSGSFAAVVIGALLCACQSSAQWMDTLQPKAIEAAETRSRFEMGCPAAKGAVLSRQVLEPVVRNVRFAGPERAEYTVGVTGCDKRQVMVVVCPADDSGCFASPGR